MRESEAEAARHSREHQARCDAEANEREQQRRAEELRRERERKLPGKMREGCPDKPGYVEPHLQSYDWAKYEAEKLRQQQAAGKASEPVFFDLIDSSGSPAGLS
jgi:hypothetical protein